MSLLTEFKRRGVARVIGSYAVIAWLLIQIVVSVEEPLGLPSWFDTLVIVALIAGFPICAVIAWVYDFTDHGIERTDKVEHASEGRTTLTRADVWTLGGALIATMFVLGTAGWLLWTSTTRAVETIAILPFELVMTDEDAAYLGEGLRDSLILRMSRLSNLRIKTTSAEEVDTNDTATLSRLLEADAIATGTVRQSGNALEISAELIAADGSILWRDQFSSEAASVLEIESTICLEMASRLGRELTAAEELELLREPTSNVAAHRLYQQGRFFWNRRTAEGFLASIENYDRAIALDPNFALAYAGLAEAYLMLLGWGVQPPNQVADLIVAAARQAIQRDPTLAQPHAVLGYYRTIVELDWEGARESFLTAISLDNNYSSAHHWYAFLLMTEGNMDAALEEILLARSIEPLSPIINAEAGYFFIFAEQYERAISELEAATLLDANYPSTITNLMRANALLGNRDAALEHVERWRNVRSDNLLMSVYGAMSLPLLGLEEEAREIYAEALDIADSVYVQPGILGVLAGSFGDLDAAFAHFDDALEEGSLVVSWLRDPLLVELHADPRYAALLMRLSLAYVE